MRLAAHAGVSITLAALSAACSFEPPFGEGGLDVSPQGRDAGSRDGEGPDGRDGSDPFDGGLMIICGDGIIDGPETCDDRNSRGGDGCSATCGLEPGWTCGGDPYRCTNPPPSAVDDQFTIVEDTPSTLVVAANDLDENGDVLSVDTFDQPMHGIIVAIGAGSLLYTPNLDYNGEDSFAYTVRDTRGSTAAAAVVVTITGLNDAPRTSNVDVRTAYDTTISIPLSARDPEGDTITYFIRRQPQHGTLNGSFAYNPNTGFTGFDDFTYSARDPSLAESQTATVTIAVLPPNWRREADAWPLRRRMTVASVQSDLQDFQVLVRLDSRYIDYSSMRADGTDLRFYGPMAGAFAYEIDQWDPTGESLVWVNVPTISSSTTTQFFMYYGNPNAIPGDDPSRTWGRDFSGVYHLSPNLIESENGSAATNNGTTDVPGLVGRARAFDGMSFLELVAGALDGQSGSASAWLLVPSTTNINTAAIALYGTDSSSGMRDGFGNDLELHLGMSANEQFQFYARGTSNNTLLETDGSGGGPAGGFNDDTWHHVAVTWQDMGDATIYIDGASQSATSYDARNFTTTVAVRLGQPIATAFEWVGSIDEVQIANVALSSEHIDALHATVMNPGFLTIGGEDDGLPP